MAVNNKINYLLLPFSFIYGLVTGIRNKLFDWGILPGEEFSVPVISVGNLTVGGTGKTPHTEYLIRLLSRKYKVAVLSRGYKRKTSGFILADKQATSSTIGDEPFQMFRKFPFILVAVDSDRRRGIRELLNLPDDKRPSVILLDDAFQHRYVIPSLSILLTDNNRLIYEDFLLPAGRLRESFRSRSRAQMVIVTKCPDIFKPIDYRIIAQNLKLMPHQQLYFTSFKYGDLIPVFRSYDLFEKKSLSDIQAENTAILLLAGIASPQGLIEKLGDYTSNLTTCIYPDHHDYTSEDLKNILEKFNQIPSVNKIIVTTEKDAVKFIETPSLNELLKDRFYYLPIEVSFHLKQENLFIQNILNHVKDFTGNGKLA